MFTGLSDGTVDAVLELWPSGITAAEQAFLDDGTVLNIGELGTVGKIGWFVPSYVIDEHPELATWEGFADPANAALFATAETGDHGKVPGNRPLVLAVRRGHHRQPGSSVPGDLLRVLSRPPWPNWMPG